MRTKSLYSILHIDLRSHYEHLTGNFVIANNKFFARMNPEHTISKSLDAQETNARRGSDNEDYMT